MPYLLPRDDAAPETTGTRYTRALVALTREVWHPDCTLRAAFAMICETAARALQVERVNIWRFEPEPQQLVCLHAYCLSTDTHAPVEAL